MLTGGDNMQSNVAIQAQPTDFGPGTHRCHDSQVNLKAPRPPDLDDESGLFSAPDRDAPADFVEFMSVARGIPRRDAFDLLCRLVAEYRTPVRREIDVLQLSA